MNVQNLYRKSIVVLPFTFNRVQLMFKKMRGLTVPFCEQQYYLELYNYQSNNFVAKMWLISIRSAKSSSEYAIMYSRLLPENYYINVSLRE